MRGPGSRSSLPGSNMRHADVPAFLTSLTPAERRIATALRRSVRDVLPDAVEAVISCAISYHERRGSGRPGAVVCQIVVREGRVRLDFIRGSWLPDPLELLREDEGRKYKRFVPIDDPRDAAHPGLLDLIEVAGRIGSQRPGRP